MHVSSSFICITEIFHDKVHCKNRLFWIIFHTKVMCDVNKFSDESGRLSDRIRMVGPLVMLCGVYHGGKGKKGGGTVLRNNGGSPCASLLISIHGVSILTALCSSFPILAPPRKCRILSTSWRTHFSARTISMNYDNRFSVRTNDTFMFRRNNFHV